MTERLNAKDARQRFSSVLTAVARGRSITITRRGKAIAKISPIVEPEKIVFPDLAEFRASLKGGNGKSATIEDLRRGERY